MIDPNRVRLHPPGTLKTDRQRDLLRQLIERREHELAELRRELHEAEQVRAAGVC